jgi:SAM-dependent methyltransferase
VSFKSQRENWEALAETDPLWAVLSEPLKRGGKWDEEAFYATGDAEALEVEWALHSLGLPETGERMLDVGCGPGRMTHAFSEAYEEVIGYDLSAQMLDMAREGAAENEYYVLNETDDLSPFDDRTFDFVYCSKTLQHIDPERVGAYMAEMVRVLRDGGVLFLQMLSHPTGWVGSKESAPDPEWGKNGKEPPHYTVISVSIDAMMAAFIYMNVIIHQARLVEGGRGQSLFSYDFIVQRRGELPERSFRFGQFGTFNEVKIG